MSCPSILAARRLAPFLLGTGLVLSCTTQEVAGPPSNANRAPTARIVTVPAHSIHEGSDIKFDATSSSDPDGDSLTYRWDLGDSLTSTSSTASRLYVDDGYYGVTLIVSDPYGASDTATATIPVENSAPVVDRMMGPAGSIGVGNSAAIRVWASDPGSADRLTMQIEWKDGTTTALGFFQEGHPYAHTYSTVGTYAVEVTIQDNGGGITKRAVDKPIVVVAHSDPGGNQPPTAQIVSPPGPFVEGRTVVFDGLSSSDPDGDSLTYRWDLGNESRQSGSYGVSTYADDGTYVVTLIVTDQHGASDTATTQVHVENASPFIYGALAPSGAVFEGTSTTIEVWTSDSGKTDSLIVEIDWKDGTTYTSPKRPSYQSGVKLAHIYSTPGTYAVEATARDNDGGVARRTVGPIVVVGPHENHRPVARIEGRASGPEGANLFFSAKTSTDPDGDSLTVTLLSGDGRTQKESRSYVSRNYGGWWSFPDDGNYIVSVIVADDSGAADTASMPVTVVNAPPNKPEWLFRPDHEAVGIPGSIQVLASDPGTADRLTIAVDWGDGTGQTLGAADTSLWVPYDGSDELGGTLFHTYQATGSYMITVTARDDDGGVSSPVTSPVFVFNANARQSVAGYEGMDLGTLGGNWARPADLNDRGQIVGTSMTDHWALHAFLWDESGMHDLGTMGHHASEAVRINETGIIAGTVWERGTGTLDDNCISSATGTTWQNGVATSLEGQGFCHNTGDPYGWFSGQPQPRLVRAMNSSGDIAWIGYGKFDIRSRLWRHGWQQMLLPSPWSPFYPTAINDRGQVVGTAHQGEGSGRFHAFVWKDGTGRDLGVLAPTTCQRGTDCDKAAAQDINESGQIVGVSTGAGHYHFVLWENDKVEDLGLTDSSTTGAAPMARIVINNHGDIAGSAGGKAYFWSGGVTTQLPTSGGALEVVQLNENGDVVGNILMGSQQHVFVWSKSRGLVDLGAGPDGFSGAWAVDINARGDILGYTAPCRHDYWNPDRCVDFPVDYWATQVRTILWRNTQASASR